MDVFTLPFTRIIETILNLIRLYMCIYNEDQCGQVNFLDSDLSELFSITNGVKQGFILALILYLLQHDAQTSIKRS